MHPLNAVRKMFLHVYILLAKIPPIYNYCSWTLSQYGFYKITSNSKHTGQLAISSVLTETASLHNTKPTEDKSASSCQGPKIRYRQMVTMSLHSICVYLCYWRSAYQGLYPDSPLNSSRALPLPCQLLPGDALGVYSSPWVCTAHTGCVGCVYVTHWNLNPWHLGLQPLTQLSRCQDSPSARSFLFSGRPFGFLRNGGSDGNHSVSSTQKLTTSHDSTFSEAPGSSMPASVHVCICLCVFTCVPPCLLTLLPTRNASCVWENMT